MKALRYYATEGLAYRRTVAERVTLQTVPGRTLFLAYGRRVSVAQPIEFLRLVC